MHAADGETLDISRTWSGPADTGQCSPRSLEEEPGAMLRLVDPVLDQARGSDIAILIAKRVCVS
jgi:hypothetical protein